MKQKKQYKNNVKYRHVATASCNFLAICVLVFGSMHACAETVSLLSQSSVVYEIADENSNAVGNLVQGNTFELKERITSENGEIWNVIILSDGTQGYMKGEVSPEIVSSAAVEESMIQEETSEEISTEEISSVMEELEINRNTKKKTYSIKSDSNRMRSVIQQTQVSDIEGELQQTKSVSVDKTFIFLICVTLVSTGFAYYSYTKIKLISSISQKYFYNPKSRKRKKIKRSKKKRIVKEEKNWKRNSLQN